jgi:hypothetical protein
VQDALTMYIAERLGHIYVCICMYVYILTDFSNTTPEHLWCEYVV